MERGGSSSPRHSDKSHSAAAAAAAAASSAQAQAAATAAFNYSAFLNASVSGGGGSGNDSVMISSTENLLRNIQSLLKVAAENARQQDRQSNYEKGSFVVTVSLCLALVEVMEAPFAAAA